MRAPWDLVLGATARASYRGSNLGSVLVSLASYALAWSLSRRIHIDTGQTDLGSSGFDWGAADNAWFHGSPKERDAAFPVKHSSPF
jgi:hypothetical protein